MATPDMDVIKEIPGYKVILKAVLKSQIQQLVEQLAANTGEESIILTASIADGTLSHISSGPGKSFLEYHEEVKSQFLGFCLKWHQKKQQEERAEAERKAAESAAIPLDIPRRAPRYPGGVQGYPLRSPGSRHQPYHVQRPFRASLGTNLHKNFQPAMKSPVKMNKQIIKTEVDNKNDISDQNDANMSSQSAPTSSQPSSPWQTTASSSHLKDESLVKDDDDSQSESSTATIPNELPQEGLGLDSDLSNLFSGTQASSSAPQTPGGSGDVDDSVSVKVEAISESDLELEITGVEPGRQMVSNWSPDVSIGMNFDPSIGLDFDPTHAARQQGDMQAAHQGNNNIPSLFTTTRFADFVTATAQQPVGLTSPLLAGLATVVECPYCEKMFPSRTALDMHIRTHTGEKPFKCEFCNRAFSVKGNCKRHMIQVHGIPKLTVQRDESE